MSAVRSGPYTVSKAKSANESLHEELGLNLEHEWHGNSLLYGTSGFQLRWINEYRLAAAEVRRTGSQEASEIRSIIIPVKPGVPELVMRNSVAAACEKMRLVK